MKEVPVIITILHDLLSVSQYLKKHLKSDEKVTQWLNTEDPDLNDLEPIELIFQGKTDELVEYIKKTKKPH